MSRFHFDPSQTKEGLITLDKQESYHAVKVLRIKPGQAVELFDGLGKSYRGLVASVDECAVSVKILDLIAEKQMRRQISLAVSVIKSDPMEWMLEKSCELGAFSWKPLLTKRVVVRVSGERWEAKVERWKKIALESCKQCGLSRVPEIAAPVEFKRLLLEFHNYDLIIIPTLHGKTQPFLKTLEKHQNLRRILIMIGPEGDFTHEEVQDAISAGAIPVSLGELVLRAETAAIYALACTRFYLDGKET